VIVLAHRRDRLDQGQRSRVDCLAHLSLHLYSPSFNLSITSFLNAIVQCAAMSNHLQVAGVVTFYMVAALVVSEIVPLGRVVAVSQSAVC
jgi:hypothetical protein